MLALGTATAFSWDCDYPPTSYPMEVYFAVYGIKPKGVGSCALSWMTAELNTSQGPVMLPVQRALADNSETWFVNSDEQFYPPIEGQKWLRIRITGPDFGYIEWFWDDSAFVLIDNCPHSQFYRLSLGVPFPATPVGVVHDLKTAWMWATTNAVFEHWLRIYEPDGGLLADVRQTATFPQTPSFRVPLPLNGAYSYTFRVYGLEGRPVWSDWQPWSPPSTIPVEWFCNSDLIMFQMVGPYPREPGFYPHDSANLEQLVGVQQQVALREREQVDLLRQLVAQGTNRVDGGGATEFESRMTNLEDKALTNAIASRILGAQGALQSQGAGILTNALSQANPFGGQATTLSSGNLPGVSPVVDDWVVHVAGYSVDLNPTRRLEGFFPIVGVYWWLLFLVFPLLWWWWAFDEARQVFAQVVLKVPDAATASSSLWGAVFKKAGVVLTLVLIALTVAAIGWAASVMINWAFSAVSPTLWSAMGTAGTAVQRVWRMANELFPVQWTISLLVTTFVGYLTIHGLVVLVITFLHSAGAFVKWAAPVVALLLLPVGWADWRLELVGPPDRGLILEAMTDRGYYTAAHYPGPSVLMPDAMGTWLVSGAWEDPPMLPLTVNAGDTVRLSIVPYSTNEWVIERFFVRRLQDERELAGVWISTAGVGLGVIAFLWAFKKAIRPLTLRE